MALIGSGDNDGTALILHLEFQYSPNGEFLTVRDQLRAAGDKFAMFPGETVFRHHEVRAIRDHVVKQLFDLERVVDHRRRNGAPG